MISEADARDVLNFFHDLPENIHARRPLLDWMLDNIDLVSYHFMLVMPYFIQSHSGMKSAPRKIQEIFGGRFAYCNTFLANRGDRLYL